MYPPGGPRQPEVNFDQILAGLRSAVGPVFARLGGFGVGGIVILGVILIGVLWAATGIYTISPGENAALRLFGAPQGNPVDVDGLHWWWPGPVGKTDVILVTETRRMELGFRSGGGQAVSDVPVPVEALMISGDLNIVDVEMVVQYNIKSLTDFLFKVDDPGEDARNIVPGQPDGRTLKDAAESALRQVIGQSSIDDVITEQRSRVETDTQIQLQIILDDYETGIAVLNVKLQDVKAPQEVQDAFQDVLRARQERDTRENEALAFKNDILPRASGEAQKILREAEAFKEARIATSQGEADQFTSILNEYRNSKDVTRQRLYLEAMEEILPGISKIIISPDAESVLILGGSGGITPVPLRPVGPQP
ncbi:MAG: FtsH protease activity modulator HflK [Chloroflexi bacterium]|nr:FtsH protease activity modulator HflK [Chloroflexota bacterium]